MKGAVIQLIDKYYLDVSNSNSLTLYNASDLVKSYVILSDTLKEQAIRDIAYTIQESYDSVKKLIENPTKPEKVKIIEEDCCGDSDMNLVIDYVYYQIPPYVLNKLQIDGEISKKDLVVKYVKEYSSIGKGV